MSKEDWTIGLEEDWNGLEDWSHTKELFKDSFLWAEASSLSETVFQ